jgi:HNH endonuclease
MTIVSSTAPSAHGCIFCRRQDGGFTSREHVFPESLGNETVILAPGVVCDRCNNGPLAEVEQALIRFPAVGFVRVLHGHTNKKGDRPVVKWANATMSSPAESEIVINAKNAAAFRIVEQVGPKVRGQFNFTTGGPVSAARYSKIARALWKTTLECVYLDHGEMVYEARFDETREMVIGARRASGFIMFPKKLPPPTTEVALTYQFLDTDLGPALGSLTAIGGVPFFTELLRRRFLGDRHEAEALFNIIEF